MALKNERLAVLSDAEQFALYGLPDFDDGQRLEYLSLSAGELALASARPGLHAQIFCALQIGYFKAKHAFFHFTWDDVREDCDFILTRYFNDQPCELQAVPRYEQYAQRLPIAELFGYRLWSADFLPQLNQRVAHIVRRDVTPSFIIAKLIAYLSEQKIVRPGYTTLQTLMSEALSAERQRLGSILADALDASTRDALAQLLLHEHTLSELAALKQDAKDFRWQQMARERQKRATLEPLYRVAKTLLPDLGISQQNLQHYAGLANFYTVYDLRRLKPEQTYLYLLCYAWQRYRQLTDNLVDALGYHLKRLQEESKVRTDKHFTAEQMRRQEETSRIGRLLLLYVDEMVDDAMSFGDVRRLAFKIMPKDALENVGLRLSEKPANKLAMHWRTVDGLAALVRRNLRPLYGVLDFSSTVPQDPWIAALSWMKEVFAKQQRLSHRPLAECPQGTVPKRLRPYLLTFDEGGEPTGVHADRYETWIYWQIQQRLKSGVIYLDDSAQHRRFSDELVSADRQAGILGQIDIPWLRRPIDVHLKSLSKELHEQWMALNRELRQGKLKHLDYDEQTKTLTWRRPKADEDAAKQDRFYEQLSLCDIADVVRFVDGQCQFLSALTPLQPRYAKHDADADSLVAVIIAQAMNYGNAVMARTSDIPYHVLERTYQQYLRLASLQAANDRISDAIAKLPIFPHYSFDLDMLYGSVDGQKFSVEHPTVKARSSRKYFARGKGVVAYTILCNHVPLQGWIIGAHEFEAHYVFDVWYRNTSEIMPDAITGDMHSINRVNFAIMHWFGPSFEPRFTDLKAQLKGLYCADDLSLYEKCLIRPVGQIDRQAIVDEKANIDRIVATLALKEMTQGTLVRKLCTYTQPNPTRRAIFEFDKLIRSIYTLRYLRDPQLERNVQRSQNRIESYHQLRSAIAQVGGKKELTGKTDIELEISNQCARLIANAIIYYNSAILSRLLDKYEGRQNLKALALIKKISPVAWRHILMNGHYTFRHGRQLIDLDTIMATLDLAA
jgi:TnpA family transposase